MSIFQNIERKKLQQALLIIIAALTAIALILLLIIVISSLSSGVSNGFSEDELTSYKITEKDFKTGTLILADADHSFTVDETMLGLVDCQNYRNTQLVEAGVASSAEEANNLPFEKKIYMPYSGMKLSSAAMIQAHKLLNDAVANVQDESVSGSITIDAAYGRQENISTNLDEFNTGLLMFLSDTRSDSGLHIPLPEAYEKWIDEHAADYGFVKSFQYGYRYVGVPHAKHMAAEDMTLAEYINFLKSKTTPGKVLKIEVGESAYAVYYMECNVGSAIPVPKQLTNADGTASNTYEISGTNEGGVIVTVKIK
jgi:hypothetical protein